MSKKHRILVVRNANGFDFGGGERYPVNLALELQNNDLEPIMASAHTKILELATTSDVKNIHMPWLKNQNYSGIRILLFPLYLIWQIRMFSWYIKTIKTQHIDALHLQSRDDFIAGTLAGKLLKKNVVWTDHADLKYVFQNITIFYKNPVGKLVYFASRYTAKIIIVSQNEKRLIAESLQGKKLPNSTLIYNGITDRRLKPKRDFDKHVPIFSLTSRLVDTKGIGEVISASKLLEKDGLNHKVLLIGEGPDEQKYKKAAGKSIVFMGYPKDALSYVAGSDIFVHPTYNEAFSLSLVEAAMLGMPVITTAIGGNPEIIQDHETGLLVKPMDSAALYRAMKEMVADNNSAHRYGVALRKNFENSFQFDRIVSEQIVPLYNSNYENLS